MGERVIMSREILFKAKRKDNGEWVEGYYLPGMKLPGYDGKNDFIVMSDGDYFAINPITICQHTGLTDKNGKKIWENDIVELPDEEGYFTCKWEEDAARFVMNGDGLTVDFDNYWSYQTEVIGNIFDNPELLEVE